MQSVVPHDKNASVRYGKPLCIGVSHPFSLQIRLFKLLSVSEDVPSFKSDLISRKADHPLDQETPILSAWPENDDIPVIWNRIPDQKRKSPVNNE